MDYKLLQGDCLELMRDIPDKSIDLVLTDPPYNIKKDKNWDVFETTEKYIEFMGKIFIECQRILKDNGALYFFHNDMPQISALMEWIKNNTNFRFNSFITLDKGDWRAIAWKNPTDKNTLRSWFNTCEYILYYVKSDCFKTEWDKTGWDKVRLDANNFKSLRKYAYEMLCFIGGAVGSTSTSYLDTGGRNTFLLPPEGVSLTKLAAKQTILPDMGARSGNCVPKKHTMSLPKKLISEIGKVLGNMRACGRNMRACGLLTI